MWYERMRMRMVGLLLLMLLDRLQWVGGSPRPLLDDGNGAPGSASGGREKWLATVPGCGDGCWGCC